MSEIDRRSFLSAAAASAAVAGAGGAVLVAAAGCQRVDESAKPLPFIAAMRAVEIPDGVEAAIVFQPLRQP
jgi:hypothetical protein